MHTRFSRRSQWGVLAGVCFVLLVVGKRVPWHYEGVSPETAPAPRSAADRVYRDRLLYRELSAQLRMISASEVPSEPRVSTRSRHDLLARRLATVAADRVRIAGHIAWATDHPDQPCGTSELDPLVETCRSLQARLLLDPRAGLQTRTALVQLNRSTRSRLLSLQSALIVEESRLQEEVNALLVAPQNLREAHAADHIGARRRALSERRDAVWLRQPPASFGTPAAVVEAGP